MQIDKSEILYRKATTTDIDLLVEFRINFLIEILGEPEKRVDNDLKQALHDYFKRSVENETYICWIAEYQQQTIGTGGMAVREQPGSFKMVCGKCGYIMNMYTLKDYRHNGICTGLMKHLIEEAGKLKIERLDLRATKDGEPVYRKIGFTEPADKTMELFL